MRGENSHAQGLRQLILLKIITTYTLLDVFMKEIALYIKKKIEEQNRMFMITRDLAQRKF